MVTKSEGFSVGARILQNFPWFLSAGTNYVKTDVFRIWRMVRSGVFGELAGLLQKSGQSRQRNPTQNRPSSIGPDG